MSKIIEITISNESGEKMQKVNSIDAIAGEGLLNDRYCKKYNDVDNQITLIESENIDYFNKLLDSNIPYVNFRRNIVTINIHLNELVGKEFLLGEVKIKGQRLCEPCKYLQDKLGQKDLVKTLLHKGGLRCQILSSGKISVNDKITMIN